MKKRIEVICLLLTGVILTGCSTVTPTVQPTNTPYPTYTPYPTHTPYPTYTPIPTPTPTDTPTPTPTLTPIPLPTAKPTTDVAAVLLGHMVEVRDRLLDFGGMIDAAQGTGTINCLTVVGIYDVIVGAPTFDVSASDPVVQNAYNGYREAIDIFASGAVDMTLNCRDFLANPEEGEIPRQQWGTARVKVYEAIDVIAPAIALIESR